MEPIEREELVRKAAEESGWEWSEARTLIEDLEEARVLLPELSRDGRYDRHGLFYQLMGAGSDAQDTLASATVGLIGMGGIGTHLATHLAAAGVGGLVITDGDRVEHSNLTRQTLFRESDIGESKVDVAADRLKCLRSDIEITKIKRNFDDVSLAEQVAGKSDLILLSADRPNDVHFWAHQACTKVGIPFSASGYIEGHGSVGPLLYPPQTPCFSCIRENAESLPAEENSGSMLDRGNELNPTWQAPSFGPLNSLVASMQANDALRWLVGLPTATFGRRMLIDSRSYEVTWEDFLSEPSSCNICGSSAKSGTWSGIADQYSEERNDHSFNSILLDGLVPGLFDTQHLGHVADIGAGTGRLTELLVEKSTQVDAYEPSEEMFGILLDRMRSKNNLRLVEGGISSVSGVRDHYDALCCLNVLDHVSDLDLSISILEGSLRPGGRLVLSVPHPVKDRTGWKKSFGPGGWNYHGYLLDDYFEEGLCKKDREDRNGDVRLRGVTSHHRTVSRYLQAVLRCGMSIKDVIEPEPDIAHRENNPVLYDKSSRVPYFLVIVADSGN
ncbi:ThiF family adenylyltransferase [Haloactinospora alba]|uniref:ThiF family adenylyltransferase n=1 Tax=Haloactinospora alba TaxID=405555 RepID=UPI0014772E1B|nr:ThiF family adenylyltransferase [Haloactinospora alba]